jgi:uncharacterized protein YndB with AHSA1/START domain
MVVSVSNVIEKKITLYAQRSRVWRAIVDPREFGAWFGVAIEGTFKEGASTFGKITLPGYEHLTMEMKIEKIEPERYFSYRWHPFAIDPDVDYSSEPTTLVEFSLEDGQGVTILTMRETGFDALPEARRERAFKSNEGGWAAQGENIARHVAAG